MPFHSRIQAKHTFLGNQGPLGADLSRGKAAESGQCRSGQNSKRLADCQPCIYTHPVSGPTLQPAVSLVLLGKGDCITADFSSLNLLLCTAWHLGEGVIQSSQGVPSTSPVVQPDYPSPDFSTSEAICCLEPPLNRKIM